MAECYPTGCTPCTQPIEFPKNPLNGDVYCVDAGNDTKKCWTYDNCIPGWRAQGPSASPSVYRGAINIKTQNPGENIEAGHFYIQTETVVSPYQTEWGIKVAQVSPVVANNRIAFNGQDWEVIPGPEVPYAEEARDINPSPDDRIGGITKNASLQDALAGTKKCDAITPYTLKNYVEEELGKIDVPTVGNGRLTIRSGSVSVGDFTANQTTDETITIPSPGNGVVTITQDGTTRGSFTMNQSNNTTINLTDNVSGPNADIPGQFAAYVNGSPKFMRGFSSWSRVQKGLYRFNFSSTQSGASNNNTMVLATAGMGGSPNMPATIGAHEVTSSFIQVSTGYNNESPADNTRQAISAWRIS